MKVIAAVIGVLILGICIWLCLNAGIFTKMMVIVHHNKVFWALLVSDVGYAMFRRWRNPSQFVWAEVPIQIGSTALVLYLLCTFFFYKGSDVQDQEVWNGKVERVVWQEEWNHKERHEDCDDKGENCKVWYSCEHEGPEWTIYTNNFRTISAETISTDHSTYQRYVTNFGGDRISGRRGDACDGDSGYTHVTEYKGGVEKMVPTAISHQFVNYLKGSKSILKRTGGNARGFEAQLKSYPGIHSGEFGPIYIDRVIDGGVNVPNELRNEFGEFKKKVDDGLDRALADLGQEKQVNILVYLAGTSDRKFLHALEESWKKGKKNDSIVIIGVKTFPQIDFVEIMAWTDIEEYKVKLKNQLEDLGTLNDPNVVVKIIVKQTGKPPAYGGFERTPMAKLKYLAADVDIAWWALLLIFLIYGASSWAVSWALEHNEVHEFVNNGYRNTRNRLSTLVSRWRR